MKKMNLALLVTMMSVYLGCNAAIPGVQVDIKAAIGVATCTGANATCPVKQSINAIGDPFTADVNAVEVTDLGEITADKEQAVTLPTDEKEPTFYSFSPSEGDLAGKKVYLGLVSRGKGRPGTQFGGINVIELFRHVEGSTGEWDRVGRLTNKEDYPETMNFTFKPNGDVTTQDVTFNLGLATVS